MCIYVNVNVYVSVSPQELLKLTESTDRKRKRKVKSFLGKELIFDLSETDINRAIDFVNWKSVRNIPFSRSRALANIRGRAFREARLSAGHCPLCLWVKSSLVYT